MAYITYGKPLLPILRKQSENFNDEKLHTIFEQDSPLTWTQESYRPPHTKYSLCCSVWGEGYHNPGEGTPVLSYLEGSLLLSWPGGYPSHIPVMSWLGGLQDGVSPT